MNIEKLEETIEVIEEVIIENAKRKRKVNAKIVSTLANLIQARAIIENDMRFDKK